ncbi:MAG: prepilin-type N-terminal cleavage/methylation domain-containing protein [Alphaproteobacteria bacterium]|nr:prepilin-type N-terminal cleavage/methylation domain-containing protein [Alphaproteobacteria bacterium]MCB9974847.1 prepilin-type N-terminal cleavage/methylation domain-containing protein [Rhodospirillales bacterium]
METYVHESAQNDKGFTLVELAVVMIIIGLLIGGILKGQEMIANAQLTSTVAQTKSYIAATNTFKDQYDAFPGDMSTAQARLANCTANPCGNGNGDSRIGANVGAVATAANEVGFYFSHLLHSELVSGYTGTATTSFGELVPTADVGGGYFIGHSSTGVTGFTAAELRPGHYLVLTGQFAAVASGTGMLTPSQAARIDRKMDDGTPASGSVISETANANCRQAAAYNEDDETQLCNIAIRVDG